jgi:hypothetical protein
MITNDIIDSFRRKVDSENFVLNRYRDQNGICLWNIICSSMDWIDVAVSYFDKNPTIGNTDDINQQSINVFTYISFIDIIVEAIKQLHLIFFKAEESKYPFEGVKDVFKLNKFSNDDTKYFKLIRACFGAHSVDLKDYFSNKSKKEKRCASWPYKSLSDVDLDVHLYPESPHDKDLIFTVKFDELYSFLVKTYTYLNVISSQIDKLKKSDYEKFRSKKIKNFKNIQTEIKNLLSENKQRLDNEYYAFLLNDISLILTTKITNSKNKRIIDLYERDCYTILTIIKDNLQNMVIEEINSFLDERYWFKDNINYEFSKLSDQLHYDDGRKYTYKSLFEYLSIIYDIDNYESLRINELYVLALIGLHYVSENKIIK